MDKKIVFGHLEKEEFDRVILGQLNRLLEIESPGGFVPRTEAQMRTALSSSDNHVFTAKDPEESLRIIGMATAIFYRPIAGCFVDVHDVVVDPAYRRIGIADMLMARVFGVTKAYAKREQVPIPLKLTCRPSRTSANNLYTRLGFTLVAACNTPEDKGGTNLYKMVIQPPPPCAL